MGNYGGISFGHDVVIQLLGCVALDKTGLEGQSVYLVVVKD